MTTTTDIITLPHYFIQSLFGSSSSSFLFLVVEDAMEERWFYEESAQLVRKKKKKKNVSRTQQALTSPLFCMTFFRFLTDWGSTPTAQPTTPIRKSGHNTSTCKNNNTSFTGRQPSSACVFLVFKHLVLRKIERAQKKSLLKLKYTYLNRTSKICVGKTNDTFTIIAKLQQQTLSCSSWQCSWIWYLICLLICNCNSCSLLEFRLNIFWNFKNLSVHCTYLKGQVSVLCALVCITVFTHLHPFMYTSCQTDAGKYFGPHIFHTYCRPLLSISICDTKNSGKNFRLDELN